MNVKLISNEKLPSNYIYWSADPYLSKLRISKADSKFSINTIQYQVDNRIIQGLKIEPKIIHKPLPVIIYCRGGNNINPIKSDMGISISTLAANGIFDLANLEFIVYTSQLSGYGLNSGKDEFGGEDLKDIIALKEIINNDSNCNANNIHMLAFSRGAMMAYFVSAKVDWVKSIVAVSGCSDLVNNAAERAGMQNLFNSINLRKEDLINRSILFNTNKLKKSLKILLLHGNKDLRVNCNDSINLSKKLTEEGIYNELNIFEDGEHSLINKKEERNLKIVEWFKKYIDVS